MNSRRYFEKGLSDVLARVPNAVDNFLRKFEAFGRLIPKSFLKNNPDYLKMSAERDEARVERDDARESVSALEKEVRVVDRKRKEFKRDVLRIRKYWISVRVEKGGIDMAKFEPRVQDIIAVYREKLVNAERALDDRAEQSLILRRTQALVLDNDVQRVVNADPNVEKSAWLYIGERGEVKYVSPKVAKLTGIKPEELVGKNFKRVLHESVGGSRKRAELLRAWREHNTNYHTLSVGSGEHSKRLDVLVQMFMGYEGKPIGTAVYLKPERGLRAKHHHSIIRGYLAKLANQIVDATMLKASVVS